MFCSNKITLAFRWRPWVNNRDTTGLSVASAVKLSRMIMLSYIFTQIFRQFGHTSCKPDAFSDRLFQFSTLRNILAIDCSAYSFALHTQYDCVSKFVGQNRFFQKGEFMAEVKIRIRIGGQRRCRSRRCSWSLCGWASEAFSMFI